ncbi:MAG: acyl-CoA thioesterase [Chloroflexi bacterium]|nr:acyl-CoA thioesterase [Chloroflexota bacterium]
MAELILCYRGVVYPWHCDHMGHMNVMWYVGKFDEATWHLLAAIGITPSYMKRENHGMVAVEQHITYKRELCPGDLITVRSGVLEMKDKAIRFFHQMRNEETGEIAANAILVGVHIDHATHKSCPFPSEVLERGRALIVEGVPET